MVWADIPPERKPERGYVRQNHPFTKPPFYLPVTLFGVDKRAVSKRVVSADVPPERKPERGHIRQNHPFTKPPFYLPVNKERVGERRTRRGWGREEEQREDDVVVPEEPQRMRKQPPRLCLGVILVGVWNGWGYGIAIFRALKFQISDSEPEIWRKSLFLRHFQDFLQISASEKYFSYSGKWPFHTPPIHTPLNSGRLSETTSKLAETKAKKKLGSKPGLQPTEKAKPKPMPKPPGEPMPRPSPKGKAKQVPK